jgi:glycosyltransferase involved in cell wall biosynthesis
MAALPELVADRARIQATRVRSDQELFRLFPLPLSGVADGQASATAAHELERALGVRERFAGRLKIVIASLDVFTERMAGPAIRAYQMARVLAREHDVQLVSVVHSDITHPDFTIATAGSEELRQLLEWCDILVFQGSLLWEYPFLRDSSKILIADVYDPFHLEQLAVMHGEPLDRQDAVLHHSVHILNEQISRADFLLCASDKQRDFWLGHLSALDRVNAHLYDEDPMFESVLAVVPFGVSDEQPRRTGPGLRGVVPGIGLEDKVIIWGGGIYDWFDPCTLIRAIDRLKNQIPDVRLVFMGTRHPNPRVGAMKRTAEAVSLSDELGLTDRFVFFNDGWVPFNERQNHLLDADIGVSTHFVHAETAFSFRTRLLDYLWAGLPIVTTEGDSLAEIVERRGLGLTVPPENVDALAGALAQLLTDEQLHKSCEAAVADVADEFRWERVLRPLTAFCRQPRRAPDVARRLAIRSHVAPEVERQWRWEGVGQDARIVAALFSEGGLRRVADGMRSRYRRWLGRRASPTVG